MGGGTTMHKTLLVGGLAATNAFAMAPAAAPTMQRVSNMRVSMMAGGNFNRLEKTTQPERYADGELQFSEIAAALSGHRLFLYGGESDATGPPLDDLCCLDLEGASWQQLIGRGMSPGRLSFAAAASIGNKVYLFGGCTGEGVTNSFHSLDVVSTMWDPIESLTSQPPSPRMGHSMVAVCSQLLVYGGKDNATGKVFAGLAVFDTQGEHWSTLQARARTP